MYTEYLRIKMKKNQFIFIALKKGYTLIYLWNIPPYTGRTIRRTSLLLLDDMP